MKWVSFFGMSLYGEGTSAIARGRTGRTAVYLTELVHRLNKIKNLNLNQKMLFFCARETRLGTLEAVRFAMEKCKPNKGS